MNTSISNQKSRPNGRQVAWFIGLTYLLTFMLDFILWRTTGYGRNTPTMIFLQLQMLFPAAVAILLGMFAFRDSPIYRRNPVGRPRWFFFLFLAYTLFFGVLAVLSLMPGTSSLLLSSLPSGVSILLVIAIVVIRLVSGKEAFARAGLSGTSVRNWLIYSLGVIAYYSVQTGLNALFHLGQPVDLSTLGLQTAGMPMPALFLVIAVQTIIVGPLIGLPIAFGEEYGWRGYLQSALTKIGKKRGILLLGLIWSAWHYPIILMGHNYPGHPILGLVLMTVYTTSLAFFLGYAMLKTGSIWLVAFLHGLNNQTASFMSLFVYQVNDPAYSFMAGTYSIGFLVVIVLLLLRDPIWRDTPSDKSVFAPGQGMASL